MLDHVSYKIINMVDVLYVYLIIFEGVQWLSGRVLYMRLRGRRLEPHRCLEQNTIILA